MNNEPLKRIIREATPEEKARHRVIREQVEQDLSELKQWARGADARRVKFPLVRSKRPGSVRLTADRIAELLEEDDDAIGFQVRETESIPNRPTPLNANRPP